MSRYLWLVVLAVGLTLTAGLYVYLLKVDGRMVEEEINHRGTVTMNAIRAIIQQHLDATVAFAAFLQGGMKVHQFFDVEEQQEAIKYAQVISTVHPQELVAMHLMVGSGDNARVVSHHNGGLPASDLPMQQDGNIGRLPLNTPGIWFLQNSRGEWLMRAAYRVSINGLPAYTISDWSPAGMFDIAVRDTNNGLAFQVDLDNGGKLIPIYGAGVLRSVAGAKQWAGAFEMAGVHLAMRAASSDRLLHQITPSRSYWELVLGIALSVLLTYILYSKTRYGLLLRGEVDERTRELNRDRLELRSREQELASLIDNAGNAILVADNRGTVCRANPAACRMFGYAPEQWQAVTIADIVANMPVFDRESFAGERIPERIVNMLGKQQELHCRRRDGSVFPCDLTLSSFDAGDGHRFSIIVYDASERKQAETQLRQLSYFDVLTGLPNRRLFNDRLEQALAIGHRQQCSIALMYIDLDRFKKANDLLGHTAGDQVLKECAQRMANSIRESDTAARLGGDEFAIILHRVNAPDCMHVAQKIIDRIKQPIPVGEQGFVLGASIGIAIFPQDGTTPAELAKRADAAMYKAKMQNLDFNFFTEEVETEMLRRLKLEQDIERAVLNQCGKLLLYYQTQHLTDGRIAGVEALIRWQHPEYGMLPPNEFIAVAEESGQIHAVTVWVLGEACRQALLWEAEGIRPQRIAINISAAQLVSRSLSEEIIDCIRHSGADPAWFEIEITEGAAMSDPRVAILIMEELVSTGISISIDDFGTGYSSLTYIKRFPATSIKIDRSFVCDLPLDAEDSTIVRSTISMIKSLGKNALAEGVETSAQADFLLAEGCDFMQGYYFSKPMHADDATEFLRQQKNRLAEQGANEPE